MLKKCKIELIIKLHYQIVLSTMKNKSNSLTENDERGTTLGIGVMQGLPEQVMLDLSPERREESGYIVDPTESRHL